MPLDTATPSLQRVARRVALLNIGYFCLEFAAAIAIGSVSLFADSIDLLEDSAVNLLIMAAPGWAAVHRARVGMVLAGVLLVPGVATAWTAWEKFNHPAPPEKVRVPLSARAASNRQRA